MFDDDDLFYRPPCMSCDNEARKEHGCGNLCHSCGDTYQREYVRYKSEPDPRRQLRMRKDFANKWFAGTFDDAHNWAVEELARVSDARSRGVWNPAVPMVPEFKFTGWHAHRPTRRRSDWSDWSDRSDSGSDRSDYGAPRHPGHAR